MPNNEPTRTRLRWTLFAAVGAMTTGYIAAVTVSTLAARAITGSELLAGLPPAVAVISTAVGTSALGRVVVQTGRRRSLILGTVAATLGAGIAAWSVYAEVFAFLLIGMAILGFGNAASHLSRYTAAELVEPGRRGAAVSLIVWAGTIGAVVGPRLLDPAGEFAESLGAIAYAGGYMATALFMAIAAIVLISALRPDPSSLSIIDDAAFGGTGAEEPMTARSAFSQPSVQLALVAMVIGQFVMVLIMTGTPIHIENHGFGLTSVGNVISAHTLGMFAFAPLVGRVVDRVGPRSAIVGSAVVLATSAIMAAAAPVTAMTVLTVALFLLGLGWNLGFVAGSTLLSVAVEPQVRPVVQGRVDSLVWSTSAVASAGSGLLLAGPGYTFLSILGAGLVGCIVIALVARRPVTATV